MSATGGSQNVVATNQLSLFRDAGNITVQASGQVITPGALATIVALGALAPGRWEITTICNYGAVGDVANNMQLLVGAGVVCSCPVQGGANGNPAKMVVVVAGGSTVTVQAIAAGAAGAVYNAVVVARRVG